MRIRFKVAWDPYRAGEVVSHLGGNMVRDLSRDGVIEILPEIAAEPAPELELATRNVTHAPMDKMVRGGAQKVIRPLQPRR